MAHNLSTGRVELQWDLPWTHTDQRPKSITVLLTNTSDQSNTEHLLDGSRTSVIVDVVPGMRYQAVAIAENDDSQILSSSLAFRAQTAG